jgi:hypothetical protein
MIQRKQINGRKNRLKLLHSGTFWYFEAVNSQVNKPPANVIKDKNHVNHVWESIHSQIRNYL